MCFQWPANTVTVTNIILSSLRSQWAAEMEYFHQNWISVFSQILKACGVSEDSMLGWAFCLVEAYCVFKGFNSVKIYDHEHPCQCHYHCQQNFISIVLRKMLWKPLENQNFSLRTSPLFIVGIHKIKILIRERPKMRKFHCPWVFLIFLNLFSRVNYVDSDFKHFLKL